MTYGSDMSFPFYPDVDGTPLDGLIWFGVAGQNPVTNPVSVFWDSLGTQPAFQPVTISKGRTVRSDGTPCRVWVGGDFSALVQNKLGAQILFEPNQPVTIGAANAISQAAASAAAALASQGAAAGSAATALAAQTATTLAAATVSVFPNSGATVVPGGIANGQGYWVQSADGNRLDRYKNIGGVATADPSINSLPTVAGVASIDVRESPRDPIGLWPIDGYTAGANPFLPNLANGSPSASANVKRAPRRAFNSLFYGRTGVTVVDNSVPGLVASVNDAAALTITNGASQLSIGDNSVTLPAGTWTIVATAMRNAGTDQPFAFTKDSRATRSATQTATSAYQRFAYSFTLAAPTLLNAIGICSDGVTSGAQIALESVEIFSGGADLGRAADDGNIYLAKSHSGAPSYASGVLSNSGNNAAVAQLPSRFACTKWSVSYLVEQTAINSVSPLLSDINSFNNFNAQVAGQPTSPANSPMDSIGNTVMMNLVGPLGSGQGQRGGFFNFVGKNYHLFTRTYDGVAEELWVDDVRLFRYERVLTDRNLRDFLIFVDLNGSGSGLNYSGLIGLWDRCLTGAEIRQFFYYQRARNPARTIPGLRSLRILAVEGDSNHGGESATCWPWLFQANDSPENIGTVWAVIGSRLDHTTDGTLSTLPALSDRVSQLDAVVPTDKFERKFILTIGIGTNDLASYSSAAAYITALRAYCVARAAAGWKVCLFTIPPKDADATHNSRRATVNADIVANWASYGMESAGRVINIAGDPIIGPDNSRTVNPTYWLDDRHFSDIGNAVVETYARAVINAI